MRQSGAVPLTAVLEAVTSPLSEKRTQEDLPCARIHSEGDGGAHRARTMYRAARKRERRKVEHMYALRATHTCNEPEANSNTRLWLAIWWRADKMRASCDSRK